MTADTGSAKGGSVKFYDNRFHVISRHWWPTVTRPRRSGLPRIIMGSLFAGFLGASLTHLAGAPRWAVLAVLWMTYSIYIASRIRV